MIECNFYLGAVKCGAPAAWSMELVGQGTAHRCEKHGGKKPARARGICRNCGEPEHFAHDRCPLSCESSAGETVK